MVPTPRRSRTRWTARLGGGTPLGLIDVQSVGSPAVVRCPRTSCNRPWSASCSPHGRKREQHLWSFAVSDTQRHDGLSRWERRGPLGLQRPESVLRCDQWMPWRDGEQLRRLLLLLSRGPGLQSVQSLVGLCVSVALFRTELLCLSLLLLLGACLPDLDPACPVGESPALGVSEFGDELRTLNEGRSLPVWSPVQGGLVVGVNLTARGVPRDVQGGSGVLQDMNTSKTLGRYQVSAANFICQAQGTRMWSHVMIAVPPDVATQPSELDGRRVRLNAEALFPYGLQRLEASYEGEFELVDEVPQESVFAKGEPAGCRGGQKRSERGGLAGRSPEGLVEAWVWLARKAG